MTFWAMAGRGQVSVGSLKILLSCAVEIGERKVAMAGKGRE
jgi:hypothetical protein